MQASQPLLRPCQAGQNIKHPSFGDCALIDHWKCWGAQHKNVRRPPSPFTSSEHVQRRKTSRHDGFLSARASAGHRVAPECTIESPLPATLQSRHATESWRASGRRSRSRRRIDPWLCTRRPAGPGRGGNPSPPWAALKSASAAPETAALHSSDTLGQAATGRDARVGRCQSVITWRDSSVYQTARPDFSIWETHPFPVMLSSSACHMLTKSRPATGGSRRLFRDTPPKINVDCLPPPP